MLILIKHTCCFLQDVNPKIRLWLNGRGVCTFVGIGIGYWVIQKFTYYAMIYIVCESFVNKCCEYIQITRVISS